MNIAYSLWNPTGNRTVLVQDNVPVLKRRAVAEALMRREPAAEQLGFLSNGQLEMAGGEFCGNATMSAAAQVCFAEQLPVLATKDICLKTSGIEQPVCIGVTRETEKSFACVVDMPFPLEITTAVLPMDEKNFTLPLIRFGGLDHLILEIPMEKDFAERAIRQWCGQLSSAGLGMMFWDRSKNRLTPLVYIPGADTLFWEQSCASGTTAIGAYLARESGRDISLALNEPGGILKIDGGKTILKLTGFTTLEKQERCSLVIP